MSLCPNCENSRFCETWGEWKCVKQNRRVYNFDIVTSCADYRAMGKNTERPKCQCDDCLSNELYNQ